jgi:LacI family transcriptional regulator
MSLTLENIAKLAGVSRATASRVVNNQPNVRPEVRERVWQVIRENDYHPNLSARSLVTHRTNLIALVVPERNNSNLLEVPYFQLLLKGIVEVCAANDYFTTLVTTPFSIDRYDFRRRVLAGNMFDGVIVSLARAPESLLNLLQESEKPFVCVGRPFEHPRVHFVDVDNFGGARDATNHLIRLGHRRIATITGPQDISDGADRFTGYKNALEYAGMPYDERLVAYGDFTKESGIAGIKQLLPHKPTALFCADDWMAVGVLEVLRAEGVRVPDELSIVGFDDDALSAMTNPPLTTVFQPVADLGRAATELLFELLDSANPANTPNSSTPVKRTGALPRNGSDARANNEDHDSERNRVVDALRSRVLPTKMVIRESTAAALREARQYSRR